MSQRANVAGFPWVLACLAPALAVVIYWGTLGHPLQTLDYEIVSTSKEAARSLRSDVIWGGSLPFDAPDLGAYRPVHGLLLRIEHGLWPGEIRRFHAVSLGLFALFVFGSVAALSRLIPGVMGRWVAAGVVVAHPMASEAVAVVSAQGVLLASAASVLALWVYLGARDGALRLMFAVPLAALLYAVAAGAHEAAFALPFALLSVELLGGPASTPGTAVAGESRRSRRRETAKGEALTESDDPTASASPAGSAYVRLAAFGLPLIIVAFILIMARLDVLGRMGAADHAAALPGMGLVSRVLFGLRFFALGCIKLVFPFVHSVFYPVRYEGMSVLLWIAVAFLGVVSVLAAVVFGRRSPLLLGLALIKCGLLFSLQLFPMSAAFSERLLVFALPGFALCLGALVERIAGAQSPSFYPTMRMKYVAGGAAVLILLLGTFARLRASSWGGPMALYQKQAVSLPKSPQPLAHQVVLLVSRPDPKNGYDTDLIRDKAEQALKLAKPPDADLVFRYLAILHLARNNADDFARLAERAITAEGPHLSGYFADIATGSLRMNLPDLAERAVHAELQTNPGNFRALYALSDVLMRRKAWDEAAKVATEAATIAPSSLSGVAYLRLGRILKQSNLSEADRFKFAARAFIDACRSEPTLIDAYIELATLYIDNNKPTEAERVLDNARNSVRLPSYVELYKLQVRNLERRGVKAGVFDFLNTIMARNPYDYSLKSYAARYFADHGMLREGRVIAAEAQAKGMVSADLFYVSGRASLELDGNVPLAVAALRSALKLNPEDQPVKDLLKTAEAKLPQPPASASPAP